MASSFKVARPGGAYRYFATLADAKAFANRIYLKTGSIVAIEATRN